MKLTVAQPDLKSALLAVGPGAKRTSLPATLDLRLTASRDTGTLEVAATDGNVWQATDMPADIARAGAGAICLPARALMQVVSRLPDGALTLGADDFQATLRWGRTELTLHGIAAEEWPVGALGATYGEPVELDAAAFRQAIAWALAGTSKEPSRPMLTSVHLETAADGTAMLAAADVFRLVTVPLAAATLAVSPWTPSLSINLKGAMLREVKRIVGKSEPLTLAFGDNGACIRTGGVSVCAGYEGGTYPNYRQLMPREHTTSTHINAASLAQSVKAMEPILCGNGILRLLMEPNTLILKAIGEELGKATIALDATTEGPPNHIAVNWRYVLDAIAAANTETVVLEMTAPIVGAVLRPVGGWGATTVIMPMFVQW